MKHRQMSELEIADRARDEADFEIRVSGGDPATREQRAAVLEQLMRDDQIRYARAMFREEIERFIGLARDCDDIIGRDWSGNGPQLADRHARVAAAMAKLMGGAP
jgi:hypothetical protein